MCPLRSPRRPLFLMGNIRNWYWSQPPWARLVNFFALVIFILGLIASLVKSGAEFRAIAWHHRHGDHTSPSVASRFLCTTGTHQICAATGSLSLMNLVRYAQPTIRPPHLRSMADVTKRIRAPQRNWYNTQCSMHSVNLRSRARLSGPSGPRIWSVCRNVTTARPFRSSFATGTAQSTIYLS
jgi:hypothetical protein